MWFTDDSRVCVRLLRQSAQVWRVPSYSVIHVETSTWTYAWHHHVPMGRRPQLPWHSSEAYGARRSVMDWLASHPRASCTICQKSRASHQPTIIPLRALTPTLSRMPMPWIPKRGMHTGRWSWVAPGRPSYSHLQVVLQSAPEAIPTRGEGLLHQAKTGFKKRRNGVWQLTSTHIPSLPNLPIAYCDYEDDTERTQAIWGSPQEHGPDAPPCPHIAPSRPRHLPEYLCIHDAVRSAGLPNFPRGSNLTPT